MHDLISEVFLPAFDDPALAAMHDGALLDAGGRRIAFTTDSYVVKPLFFPGGDIGNLAVRGTVNDLAMCGARPAFMSAACILEEGFSIKDLRRIAASMAAAAREAGVRLVTGDTKVVPRGQADGLFINTAGIGMVEHDLTVGPASVRPGDVVLLSGDIGRHGIAVLSVREGLSFENPVESDTADLSGTVAALFEAGVEVHCLRDLTRGGLATALVELAEGSGLRFQIRESDIPVCDEVAGACEVLGFDPLHVANEGRFVALVPKAQEALALDVLRRHPLGRDARTIGSVSDEGSGTVVLRGRLGVDRPLDMPRGDLLPRIC